MSVLNKIKEVTQDIERLAKEKSKVTLIENSVMLVENYSQVKLFTENKLLLELDYNYLLVCGSSLVIEFFSPSRIVMEGEIKSISYLEDCMGISEEL